MKNILLVRPENRLEQDIKICEENQYHAFGFPIIQLCPIQDLNQQIDFIEKISWADVIFWVSPSAVEIADLLIQSIQQNQSNQINKNNNKINIMVGQATANALKKSHYLDNQIIYYPDFNLNNLNYLNNDSESVLKLSIWQDLPTDSRILIIKGTGGRDFLEKNLHNFTKKNFHIQTAEIYTRKSQVPDFIYLNNLNNFYHQANHQLDAIWITSSELVKTLFVEILPILPQISPSFAQTFTQNLKSLIYFTLHERIAQTLLQYGVKYGIDAERIKIIPNLNYLNNFK